MLASILAAEISAGTFFGAPGEGYALRNYTYVQLIVGYLLARVVVSAVFIPAYYQHNVVSIYEFLGMRFGPRRGGWLRACSCHARAGQRHAAVGADAAARAHVAASYPGERAVADEGVLGSPAARLYS